MRRLLPLALLASCAVPLTPPDKPLALASLFDHVIALEDPSGRVLGSGVVVASGYVLTAKHVGVAFKDAVVQNHPDLDICLLKWETGQKTRPQIAPRSTFLGEEVFLVAFTGNASQVITGGLTGHYPSRLNQKLHSCEAAPGTSGGGMFDSSGRLVGIQLGCLMTWGPEGMIYSDPEGRYLAVEGWSDWLSELL